MVEGVTVVWTQHLIEVTIWRVQPLEPGSGRAEAAHMIATAQHLAGWSAVHQPVVDNTNKRWSSRNLSSDFP